MRILFLLIAAQFTLFGNADSLSFPPDSLIAPVDSVTVDSASVITAAPDTIISIFIPPMFNGSSFISNEEVLKSDYRYAGDLINLFPGTSIRHLGFYNQPSEVSIYGSGFNSFGYLENGLLLNDRMKNYYDLNYIQTEDIDSIEIIPSVRSFMYGPDNNVAVVNFITKNFVPPAPYSRIKYYEGPFEEAMVDAQFSIMPYKKMNVFVDITNRKSGNSYSNTESSLWQAKVKLKYFLSNSINISADYFYNKADFSLNGGIAVDSLIDLDRDVNYYLYNERLAPVLYSNRYQKNKQHLFQLRFLASLFDASHSDLNFYYKFNLDEFRQNENGTVTSIPSVLSDDKQKILGANLNQRLELGFLSLHLSGFYEHRMFLPNTAIEWYKNNLLGFSGSLTFNFNDLGIAPSFFTKTLHYDSKVYNGVGGDVSISVIENSKIYFGVSRYERLHLYYPGISDKPYVLNAEAGAEYQLPFGRVKSTFFYKKYSGEYFYYISPTEIAALQPKDDFGLSIYTTLKYWKIELELSGSFYKSNYSVNVTKPLPDFSFNTGLWYKDVLFDSSLNLKSGFKFYFNGSRSFSGYDFNAMRILYRLDKPEIGASATIDFFLAGEVKETAIIYFTWENLLDNQYYITPYYPMPRRGIRFGISWEFLN